MGDEKVLIAAIELLQNLVVTTEPDDILIKKVKSPTRNNAQTFEGRLLSS
jgi:hypothetical protein